MLVVLCHAGGNDGSTTILVEGLPETFNASESYAFTVTLVNDKVRYGDMILHKAGVVSKVDSEFLSMGVEALQPSILHTAKTPTVA